MSRRLTGKRRESMNAAFDKQIEQMRQDEVAREQTSDLPWSLGQNGDKCARNHAICSGPRVIAKVLGAGYPIGEGWSPRSEADAQLIITAVNHHEALVGALEAARTEIQQLRWQVFGNHIPGTTQVQIDTLLATIRQAAAVR